MSSASPGRSRDRRPVRFEEISFSREKRYSLGRDTETGRFYLSIPVANQLVDYEEYYAIDGHDLERFLADEDAAIDFADRCRRREMDHLLIVAPGGQRGVAT